MYLLFIPAAVSVVLILAATIRDQIGSKPDLPMLEQIEQARKDAYYQIPTEADEAALRGSYARIR